MSICAADRPAAWRAGLALGTALVCLGAAAKGPEPRVVEHRVRRGDTVAELATRYYGSKERAEALARLNDVGDIRNLSVGRVLRIPLGVSYRVRAGDTPSELAERHLGGASRHAALMELNGMSGRAALGAGEQIEIPVVLEHKVGDGETLGVVAQRYYGDAGRAGWLAAFNGISRPDAIERGTRLEVPVTGWVPARAARPAPAATAKAAGTPASSTRPAAQPPASAASRPAASERKQASAERKPAPAAEKKPASQRPDPAVERALVLYSRGDYRKAADLLDAALESGALEGSEKGRALRHRAYCAVATGDRGTARRTFQALLRHDPRWKPDPLEDSPKIRQVFSEAVAASSPSRPPSGS